MTAHKSSSEEAIKARRALALKHRISSNTLKLLSIHPVFLTEIAAIRKQFDIKPNGLSQRGCERWMKIKGSESMQHVLTESFQKELKRINELPFPAFDREASIRQLHKEIPLNKFRSRIHQLLKLFKLPSPFYLAVESFLFYNYFTESCLNSSKNWKIAFNQDTE